MKRELGSVELQLLRVWRLCLIICWIRTRVVHFKGRRSGIWRYFQRCKNPKQPSSAPLFSPTSPKHSNPALPLNTAAWWISATGTHIEGWGFPPFLDSHAGAVQMKPNHGPGNASSPVCADTEVTSLDFWQLIKSIFQCGSSICATSCIQDPHGVYKKAQFITMATQMQANNIFVRKCSYINEIVALRRTDNGMKSLSDLISLLSACVFCDSTPADIACTLLLRLTPDVLFAFGEPVAWTGVHIWIHFIGLCKWQLLIVNHDVCSS